MDPLGCGWDTATFLIFSENVFAPLIYYSHLGPLIASLLIGALVLFNNPRALINRALVVMMGAFSLWVYFDLILWASERPEYIMFFWSAIVPVELLIYAGGWYLVAVLANQGNPPTLREQLIAAATFIPIFLFSHTSLNLLGFDFTNCDREAIEGPLIQYLYAMELLFIGWIVALGVRAFRQAKTIIERRWIAVIASGVFVFLFLFSAGNILVSYVLEFDWSYEQYKLFGMPILAAFITYSAIRFRAFDLKIFTAQALVIATALLVFSLLFIRTIQNVRIITALTFVLIVIIGYILIRNVRKEIEQRKVIEAQAHELEMANKQQETLLHFISHEVKGYLTESQAGFAAIIEGDYGDVSEKLKSMASDALAGTRKGVATVMNLLDASNFKKGTVNYKKESFDLRKTIKDVVEDLKLTASKKGLSINLDVGDGEHMFTGDSDKIKRHVIRNLIDNAIKYSPHGTINVRLTDGKILRFSVKDTGIGITPDDMRNLFTEGGHGKNSIKINVHSTGYGLFIAKQVVEAHGGKIWAESKGDGRGAKFIVEFPLPR